MPDLIHLVYASVASQMMTASELEAILSVSRKNNVRDRVTGMLLFTEGSFFQVLEGSEPDVQSAFNRIESDPRHQQPTCIIREPIARRAFGEWTMGFTALAEKHAATIVGHNDFFESRSCLDTLDAGRARKLLKAFGEGRWRTRLNPRQLLVSAA
ncbi:MAG: BLUF domain-containing protein [Gemmatimonadaceae bacterium]